MKSPAAARSRQSPPGAQGFKAPSLKKQARDIERLLRKAYPDAKCELDYRNALELAVATILSAQCTDKRVNMVTPALFARYPDARALAAANPAEVEEIIKSTGFFRNKAKSIVGMAKAAGRAPRRRGAAHDGGARRCSPASAARPRTSCLGNAFGMNEGVVVDTHVARLGARLGLTKRYRPGEDRARADAALSRESWTLLSHLLIWHGRRVCDAKKPRCADCVLRRICPSAA